MNTEEKLAELTAAANQLLAVIDRGKVRLTSGLFSGPDMFAFEFGPGFGPAVNKLREAVRQEEVS
jgi:hypothetical protein